MCFQVILKRKGSKQRKRFLVSVFKNIAFYNLYNPNKYNVTIDLNYLYKLRDNFKAVTSGCFCYHLIEH